MRPGWDNVTVGERRMRDPWMLWGTDDVWVDVIMVLAHGCTGERMRSGWTLPWFWPMDALGNG